VRRDTVCCDANIISDGESDDKYEDWEGALPGDEKVVSENKTTQGVDYQNMVNLMFPTNLPMPEFILDEDAERLSAEDQQTELLRWHYRLGHLPFKRVKLMAQLVHLPKNLAHLHSPKCDGCLFGAMYKKSRRNKGKKWGVVGHTATKPGQIF
jgi:hypothetical protein